MNLQCPITHEQFSFGALSNFQELAVRMNHPIVDMPIKAFLGTAFMPRNFNAYSVSEQRILWLAALHKTKLLTVSCRATPSYDLVASSYWRVHSALVHLSRLTAAPTVPTYHISAANADCSSLVIGWLTEIENYIDIGRTAYNRSRLDLGASALERRFERQLQRAAVSTRDKSKPLFSQAMLEFCVSQLALKSATDRAFYLTLLRADVIQLASVSKNPYMDFLDLEDYIIDWHSDSTLRLKLLAHVRFQLSMLNEFGFKPAVARLEEQQDSKFEENVEAKPTVTRAKTLAFSTGVPTAQPTLLRSNYPTFIAYVQAIQTAKLGGAA